MKPARIDLSSIRNIGIIAHIDAGKTTVTERILFSTGRTHHLGSVDDGNTVTDWMVQERERGITIVSAAVTTRWRDHQINLIDTPGHIDFTAEVQRALRVLDGGIVVFDAVHGVEPQSETVWRQADRFRVPRICFVNKMDRPGADFAHALQTIRDRLGADAIALQLPVGAEKSFEGVIDLVNMRFLCWPEANGMETREIPAELEAAAKAARLNLVEKLAETDDALLERYLAGEEPPSEQLVAALRCAVLANRLFPVLCGAALRNKGIQPLLDAVIDYLPSPLEIGPVTVTDPEQRESQRRPDDAEPLTALAFKIVRDPYVGHLTYLRVYSGTLHSGQQVYNATQERQERIGRLVRMHADHREDVEEVHAGDIAAALGMKTALTGDTLCTPEAPVLLERISFPEPVIRVSVEPKSAADQDKLADALRYLAEEDPTFKISVDEETGQTIMAGMGELHLEILADRVRREYGVEANLGRPRVSYRETISQPVPKAEGRHVRQTGGHGQYGHVIAELKPAERGTGIRFENGISGGVIPREFIPAIEQGFRDAANSGMLAGYPVTDVDIRLYDGSTHHVDSSEPAYRSAAAQAFREGMKLGGPVLLEPFSKMEVVVPTEYLGEVLAQLSSRRCEIAQSEPRAGGVQVISGMAPLAEMFGYATQLRSATQGRGVFSLEFDHYAPVPPGVAKQVLAGNL